LNLLLLSCWRRRNCDSWTLDALPETWPQKNAFAQHKTAITHANTFSKNQSLRAQMPARTAENGITPRRLQTAPQKILLHAETKNCARCAQKPRG